MPDTGWGLAWKSLVHEWKTSSIREIPLRQMTLQALEHYDLGPIS